MNNYEKKYKIIAKQSRPQDRGRAFEKLIMEILSDEIDYAEKAYREHNTGQEIDGVVEIKNKIFLIEIKWEENGTLAASKLYSFLGKINSKIEGTLGVFVSHERLKDNFIKSARDGISQRCVIINGIDNIMPILQGKARITDYIWYLFLKASSRGDVTAPIAEFINLPNNNFTRQRLNGELTHSPWAIIYKSLSGNDSLEEFQGVLTDNANSVEEISEKVLSITPVVHLKNYDKLANLIKWCAEKRPKELKDAVIHKLKGDDWKELAIEYFEGSLLNKIDYDPDDAEEITNKALENLKENRGNYDEENYSSIIIKSLLDYIKEETKKELILNYFEIFCDHSRKAHYPQKKLSTILFNMYKDNPAILLEIIEPLLKDRIRDRIIDEEIDFVGKRKTDDLKSLIVSHIINAYKDFFSERIFRDVDFKNKISDLYDKYEMVITAESQE